MNSFDHHPIEPDLHAVAERLAAERPRPSGEFHTALLGRLITPPASPSGRTARVRALVAAYAGSGLLLLGVAAVGVAGIGPFSA